MPRPFPFPINVGTDICSVPRIFNILKLRGERGSNGFLRRILTDKERNQFFRQQTSYSRPLRLWHEFETKKIQLDLKRQELGIPQNWKKQPPLRGVGDQGTAAEINATTAPKLDGTEDLDATIGEQSRLETTSHTVNNVEIYRQLTKGIADEQNAVLQEVRKTAQFIAGRYAAKEAAMKAYRHRRLTWHDIWIRSRGPKDGMSQAPEALIISESGSWKDAQIVPISISHDQSYATAVCLAFDAPKTGGGLRTGARGGEDGTGHSTRQDSHSQESDTDAGNLSENQQGYGIRKFHSGRPDPRISNLSSLAHRPLTSRRPLTRRLLRYVRPRPRLTERNLFRKISSLEK